MNEARIREILTSQYDRLNWSRFINKIFNADLFSKPKDLSELSDRVEYIGHLGSFNLAENKKVGLFEVLVKPNINLLKNRVELRNIAAKLIDQDIINGALVIFYVKDQDDYRFSFISKQNIISESGEIIKMETAPKRFTYILGPSETCLTPARRFNDLIRKPDNLTIDDLFDAFSVETLNDDFFKRYKEFYNKFYKYLMQSTIKSVFYSNNSLDKKAEKSISEFVKLLLGRIVFLYFVQKKGWLGVPKNQDVWKGGDLNFLSNFYKNFSTKEHFYSRGLSKLFFSTLNTKRESNIFELTDSKIPYLNGGLFDNKHPNSNSVDFPPKYFEELFTFFDSYNFTVDENLPDDNDVGIDPEMLGHIFENLLEENRSRGVFYTPKEIVHYMCQESLIQFIWNQVYSNRLSVEKAEIVDLIRNKIVSDTLKKNAKIIDSYFNSLKICDPAIGSGAFPMGMLKEIYTAKLFLFPFISPQYVFDPAQVKNQIIQSSIYGVDIDSGAVDIARLRFWLSLIVDETYPHPLPNLDYKIMQGDSLLESFEGIDLSKVSIKGYQTEIEDGQAEFFSDHLKNGQTKIVFDTNESDRIINLLDEYYSVSGLERKKQIHKEIDQIVLRNIHINLEAYKDELLIRKADEEKKILEKKKQLKNGSAVKELLTKSKEAKFIKSLENEIDQVDDKFNRLKQLEETEDRPYFLWSLFFMDVIQDGGFDIFIGNPPYIQLQKNPSYADKLQKENYETFIRTGDVYMLFYEQGFRKLKPKGVLSYISSNTWMRTNFGKKLREYFVTRTNPLQLINFEDTQIFKQATVETNIILNQKSHNQNNLKAISLKNNYKKGTPLADYLEYDAVTLTDLDGSSWIVLPKTEMKIKEAIQKIGKKLSEWDVEFYRGFLTGFNDAFFINERTKNHLINEDNHSREVIKPLIRGREIKKYTYSFNEQYVIFTRRGFEIDKYPSIKKHLLNFKEKLEPRPSNWNISRDGEWQGRKPGAYQWYDFQDNIAYHKIFEKDKIIWLAITDKPAFALDTQGMYVTAPAYIMTSNYNKYLLTILNSKLIEWYLDKVTSSTGQGANQWSKVFVEQLPIPELDSDGRKPFEIMADYLIYLNSEDKPSANKYASNEQLALSFEDVLNMCVYELYFKDHMKENDIDVLQFINFPQLEEDLSDTQKAELINKVYTDLQPQDNPIRNRIILANIKSKDIIRKINSTTH